MIEKITQLEKELSETTQFTYTVGTDDLRKMMKLFRQYRKALEGLTPGGSEFVCDPEYCAAYVKKRRDFQHGQILKLTKELKDEKSSNQK